MALLSIVVPTHNRPHTAEICLRELIKIPGEIDFVVVDCSAQPDLREIVAELGDDRLQYHYGPPCSMTENWNRAIPFLKGDFVTFIGDDDSFLPSGVRVLEALAPLGYPAIAYPSCATYFWDDFPNKQIAGNIILSSSTHSSSVTVVNTMNEATSMLRYWKVEPQPKIYHGIVARSVLLEIENRFGKVFRTLAPDTYLSGLLSGLIEEHLVLPITLSIHGKSGDSNSGRILNRHDHRHRNEYGDEGKDWHPIIPPVNTVEAYVADSLLRSYLDLDDSRLLTFFQRYFIGRVYGQSLLRNPNKATKILTNLWRHAGVEEKNLLNVRFACAALSMISRRVGVRLLNIISGRSVQSDRRIERCASLEDAIACTQKEQENFVLPNSFLISR